MYLRGDIELMGVREIATLCGVSKERAWQIVNGEHSCPKKFPEPVAALACGRIWLADEVREWKMLWMPYRKTGRPGGRPRRSNA